MNPEKENLESLFITFLSGNASEIEKDQINSILSSSNESCLLLVELSQIWDASGMAVDEAVDTDQRYRKLISKIRKSHKIPFKFNNFLRYAAIILFGLVLGITLSYYFQNNKFNKTFNKVVDTRIISPLGSKTNLFLADGTEVWLNAGSTLSYSSSYGNLKERKVFLEGEAFFKVKENKKKPFLVIAQGIVIRALGTSFNVKAYANEHEIVATLVEGKISVSTYDQKDEEVILLPNESVEMSRKNNEANVDAHKDKSKDLINTDSKGKFPMEEILLRKGVNTAMHTSWKDNRWIIENEELGSLAKKLERRYAVNIQFKDEKLADIRFTGILIDESLEQVLEVISFATPIKCRIDGSSVFLDKK